MFEKEAEEFVDSKKSFWRQGRTCIDSVKQAYQQGAEFGCNKANEWHDLRKNPDDLPEDGIQVLSEKGDIVIYKSDCFLWFEYSPNEDNIRLRNWEKPIAWCEKPKFEEIEENEQIKEDDA